MDRNLEDDDEWERLPVALRKESVDRNPFEVQHNHTTADVALRKESVDRNQYRAFCRPLLRVALRKESVDRNP